MQEKTFWGLVAEKAEQGAGLSCSSLLGCNKALPSTLSGDANGKSGYLTTPYSNKGGGERGPSPLLAHQDTSSTMEGFVN